MYSYFRGNILHTDSHLYTIEPIGSGIGYEVFVSPNVIARGTIDTHEFWIHHHINDAWQTLFGFVSTEERALFRQLLRVNGIGGKTALSILWLGEESILRAIQLEDDKLLASVPGIGKKTAQKIIVDLKWSIDFSRKNNSSEVTKKTATDTTLVTSLIAMGYDKSRVESVVSEIDTGLSVEQKTVLAIRKLAQ